jgi:glycosyltransferase involved in cell wall biosynthesis
MSQQLESQDNNSSTAPSVDVAIVTYNHQPYIRVALESVLAQETSFPVRIIVGDDASTDGTQEIIREFCQNFPNRITAIFHDRNLGVIHPDRIGFKVLRACTGKYVAMLDGDDYWTDPEKLQIQADYLESHPECSICHHAVQYQYEDNRRAPTRRPKYTKSVTTLFDLLGCTNYIHTAAALYRRECLPEIPAWLAKLPLGDWPMWCLLGQAGDYGFIDRMMSVYRVRHYSSWSHQSAIFRIDATMQMFRELRERLDPKYSVRIANTLARFSATQALYYIAEGNFKVAGKMLGESIAYLRKR